MPVNSIWEGSGNIMCLDVLRVLAKQPGMFDLLAEDFAQVKGQDRHFDRSWRQLQQKLRKPQEAQGREIAHQLFLLGLLCHQRAATGIQHHAAPRLRDGRRGVPQHLASGAQQE